MLLKSIVFSFMLFFSAVINAQAMGVGVNDASNPTRLHVWPTSIDNAPFHNVYYMLGHNTMDQDGSIEDWLDAGFRAFELDVIDRGDWEDIHDGPYVTHSSSPGDKFCSGNPDRLGHCLRDIKQWWSNNQEKVKVPIVVFVDMKISWDPGSAWFDDEIADLDIQIRKLVNRPDGISGPRPTLFTPDDLVQWIASNTAYLMHKKSVLQEMVWEGGWPPVAQMKDKIIVVFVGGNVLNTAFKQNEGNFLAAQNIVRTRGQKSSGFYCPYGRTPVLGSMLCANTSGKALMTSMGQSNTTRRIMNHAAVNNSYESNFVAVAHGFQFINRKIHDPNEDHTFSADPTKVEIPLVGYRRSLPGIFAMRASNMPNCVEVHQRHGNGTSLLLGNKKSCTWRIPNLLFSNTKNLFKYTWQRQIAVLTKSKKYGSAFPFCVGIQGDTSQAGASLELQTCNTGSGSQQWTIHQLGVIRNVQNPTLCWENPVALNQPLTVERCDAGPSQQMVLVPHWRIRGYDDLYNSETLRYGLLQFWWGKQYLEQRLGRRVIWTTSAPPVPSPDSVGDWVQDLSQEERDWMNLNLLKLGAGPEEASRFAPN